MLVVTRRINESIIIDTGKDKIEIVLKDIRGREARIGVHADKRYTIVREELMEHDSENND